MATIEEELAKAGEEEDKISKAVRAERERIRAILTRCLNGKAQWINRFDVRALLEEALKDTDYKCPECGTLMSFVRTNEYWCEQCKMVFYRKADLRVEFIDKQHSKDGR